MERHEYDNVTSAEISQAYAEFCADKGWNALATSVVERTLPDIMLEKFHVTKSHDIERNGKKSNRGWRRVRLNAPTFQLVECIFLLFLTLSQFKQIFYRTLMLFYPLSRQEILKFSNFLPNSLASF